MSLPDSSGWKPAPSSSIAARCPRTTIWPEVGCKMPAMHLSRVDLPEPLRPMIPKVSPVLTSNSTSRSAQKSSCGHVTRVQDPLFQRGVLLLVEAEPLGDVLDVDRGLQWAQSSSAKLPSTLPKITIATMKSSTETTKMIQSTTKYQCSP